MKVLILSDDRYAALSALWKGAEGVPLAAAPPVELPDARELHQRARNGEAPEAFAQARAQHEAAIDAAEATRERVHELISEAAALGVQPATLARWTGYSNRRVHQIVGPR